MSAELVVCDCRDGIAKLEDESAQLFCTSPPYAQGLEYELGLDYDGLWSLVSDVAVASLPKCKPSGFFFVNFGETTKYDRTMGELYNRVFRDAGWIMHSRRMWKKKFASCSLTGAMTARTIPAAEFECIWTFRKPPNSKEVHRDKKLSLRGVWDTSDDEKTGVKGHPAAFPVGIPSRAIRVWTDPGDLVVDPFAGTCTTGVACLQLDREFIGFEMDEKYAVIGKQRLSTANSPLFV